MVLSCKLYNASYEANFTSANGQQDIRIPHIQALNEVMSVDMSHSTNIENSSTHDFDQMERYSYMSIIGELGDFFSGDVHQKTTAPAAPNSPPSSEQPGPPVYRQSSTQKTSRGWILFWTISPMQISLSRIDGFQGRSPGKGVFNVD